MWTILIFISLINGYYFAIKWIFEKESKEKIFYIVFMTIVFILLMTVVQMLGLWFLNIILYLMFLFIVHSFYTDFAFITKINEYFLKNAKNEEFSLRVIIIKLLNKEMILLRDEIYWLIHTKWNIFDMMQITFWIAFIILLLLHIIGIIDVFVLINKFFL